MITGRSLFAMKKNWRPGQSHHYCRFTRQTPLLVCRVQVLRIFIIVLLDSMCIFIFLSLLYYNKIIMYIMDNIWKLYSTFCSMFPCQFVLWTIMYLCVLFCWSAKGESWLVVELLRGFESHGIRIQFDDTKFYYLLYIGFYAVGSFSKLFLLSYCWLEML